MEARESRESNDLFFVCSIIDRISRKTKNTRKDTVNMLGVSNIEKLYNLADVYHCENIDKVTDEFIEKANVRNGNFDNIAMCEYSVPTYWDMGRVYNRLIRNIEREEKKDIIDVLFEVYNSWITDYIDDYNSNMYYSNPDYIYQSYKNGSLIEE